MGVNDKLMQYIRRKEIDRRLESHETFRHVGGTGYGILAIDDVLPSAKDPQLQQKLREFRQEHAELGQQTGDLLREYGDDGKDPNPMARGMAWMKTNMKLGMHANDATVADLMTDGCNMGMKSLNQYLNQYESANEKVRHLTRQLLDLENRMVAEMKGYL